LEILFAYLDPMDILGFKKNIISNSNNNKQKNHFTTTLIPKKKHARPTNIIGLCCTCLLETTTLK
jgi:hypothetical protein